MRASSSAKTISAAVPGSAHQADLPSRSHAQKAKQPAISATAAAAKAASEAAAFMAISFGANLARQVRPLLSLPP